MYRQWTLPPKRRIRPSGSLTSPRSPCPIVGHTMFRAITDSDCFASQTRRRSVASQSRSTRSSRKPSNTSSPASSTGTSLSKYPTTHPSPPASVSRQAGNTLAWWTPSRSSPARASRFGQRELPTSRCASLKSGPTRAVRPARPCPVCAKSITLGSRQAPSESSCADRRLTP